MRRYAILAVTLLAACSAEGEPANQSLSNRDLEVAAPAAPSLPAAEAPPSAPLFQSRFTTGGIKPCKVIDKNEEEGPYYRHLCHGIGGYKYEIVESDLRQHLVIIDPNGKRTDLNTYGIGGGGFSVFGGTMDWRGSPGAPPRTLTVRFDVQQGEDGGNKSQLLVIKLATPACVVGVVPPKPGQSDEARAIADRASLPPCVKDPQ